MKSYMIYRRYTIDLIFRGGWMRKFFIVLITGVVIISAIALYFIIDNFNINTMDTTERMTFFLQVLAGFVTACISTWGLSIAHRQIKHWEIDKCDDLREKFITSMGERNKYVEQCNLDNTLYDRKIDESLTIPILSFWENLARLEKRSYVDRDIFYDSFYVTLFENLESGIFDDYLKESYQKNKHLYYHTRTLYIKWKKRYDSEKDHKDHKDSWDKMQVLIKEARKK